MNTYFEQLKNFFYKNLSLDKNLFYLYYIKFDIFQSDNIATAGSCFAQKIAKDSKIHGQKLIDVEPEPASLGRSLRDKYGFGIYSTRFENIFTKLSLFKLLQEILRLIDLSKFIIGSKYQSCIVYY